MGYFDDHLITLYNNLKAIYDLKELSKFCGLFDEQCRFNDMPYLFVRLIELTRKLSQDIQAFLKRSKSENRKGGKNYYNFVKTEKQGGRGKN